MRSLGGLMVLLGAGSFILNMLDRQFTLLMWIDNWGPTVGIAIRVGLILLGVLLFIASGSSDKSEEEDEA